MNAGTTISDVAGEVRPPGPARRSPAIDVAAFAILLNTREVRLGGAAGPARADSPFEASRQSLPGHSGLRAEKAEVPRSDPDLRKSTERNPHADDNTTDRRSPARASDSGQSRRASSGESVDGCEKGVQPGASTEAAVNAQSFESAGDPAGGSNPDAAETVSSDSAATQLRELAESASDLPAPAGAGSDKPPATMDVSARSADRHTQVFPPNVNLPDGGIVYGTGLAEHFIRLLTDQFSTLKGDATPDTPAAGAVATGTSAGAAGSTEAKALPAATPTVPLAEETPESMNKILQIIRANVGRRQSQMTVQLDPPELGKMKLDVRLVDNTLRLFVITETDGARHILLDRMETLRSSLEQSGITMAKFEVVTKSPESQSNPNWNFPQGHSQGNSGFFGQQRGSNGFTKEEPSESFLNTSDDAEQPAVIRRHGPLPLRALNLVA